jgi:hypothetical protein
MYVVKYLSALTSSCIADKLKKIGNLSTTCIKFFLCSTLLGGTSVLFLIHAFWGQSSMVSVVIFTSSMGLHGLAASGVYVNSIELASSYSGTIFGMSQVLVAMTGYVATKLVALLTKEDQSFQQWAYMFWILVGVNLFAMAYFVVFGSGEEKSRNSRSSRVEMEQLGNKSSKNECSADNEQSVKYIFLTLISYTVSMVHLSSHLMFPIKYACLYKTRRQ